MLQTPFYNPKKSYEDNYDKGPYAGFADKKVYQHKGEPKYDFLGHKVYLPFGIPAGPLLNSKFVKAAFEKGFDIAVYKTVRADYFPCHPWPNVLSVNIRGNLTLEKAKKPLKGDNNYHEALSITNSFGVPSRKPEIWQEDANRGASYAKKGQVMVLSFMGTVKQNQTQKEFIEDFILAAKLANETGAKLLEANLSCPNIGNEGLVCYNLEATEKVVKGIRKVIGNTPLSLKVGYYRQDSDLAKLAEIANEYANSISGINSLQAPVVTADGKQALPGGAFRLISGICGNSIKWAGLDHVRRLSKIRTENKYKFGIEGVGGVTVPADYFEYKETGADSVMSATGAMWNPYLAQEIKKKLNFNK
jgi:dihydroorotate dehydrogenase